MSRPDPPPSAPQSRPEALGPRDLAGLEPESSLVGRNPTKADVLFYRLGAQRIAVKTYARRPWWIRNTLGRWLIRRETAAFQAAAGVPGLPAFLGRLGPHAFATEWIEARTLADLRSESIAPEVFDQIDAILGGLHRRGIALSDLHHRDVLLTAAGGVYLVDLAMAYLLGGKTGALRRRIFARMCDQDRIAATRLRARWSGIDEVEAIAAVGARAAARYRRARQLKAFWDRLRGKRRG